MFLYKSSASIVEILSCFAFIAFVVLLSEKAASPSFASWHQVFLPIYIMFGLNASFMIANVVNLIRHPENLSFDFNYGIAVPTSHSHK